MTPTPSLTATGVLRRADFSPQSDDRTIMDLVVMLLERAGVACTLVDEDYLSAIQPQSDIYFSMARSARALEWLQMQEKRGARVVNPVRAIEATSRLRLMRLAARNRWPFMPWSMALQTTGKLPKGDLRFPAWVKRADQCAQERDDVVYVQNVQELQTVLLRMHLRGIGEAQLMEHVEGDIIKFYGVAGTEMFAWYYPTEPFACRTKFQLEARNGAPRGCPLNRQALRLAVDTLAQATGLMIYGGDAILTPQGEVKVIDFNDWPSFGPCRHRAASAIARLILQRI